MANPTYQNDLVLCNVFFKHDLITREAEITFALNDNTANVSAQGWADAVFALAGTVFAPQLDTAAQIMRATTLKGDGTSTFTTGISTGASVRGTNAMSSTTPNCAILVKKNTGFGGRENRGRMYLPFMMNEGEVDEAGNISAGVQGDINDMMQTFIDDVEGGGDQELVIANRTYDAPWNVKPRHLTHVAIGEHVTSITCEPVIATQRRRMPR